MRAARPQGSSLPTSVTAYVAGVVVSSLIIGAGAVAGAPTPDPRIVLFWIVAFLAGELMHLQTPTGKGNVSMAAALHLAAVPLLPAYVLFPVGWLARLCANLLFQKQPWYKALFNAAQVSMAVVIARWGFELLAGPTPIELSRASIPAALPPLLVATLAYYSVNVGLVCGVLSLVTRASYFRVWRENYGYRVELVSSAALFLLAPVVTITYQTASGVGILLFFLPMLFIRDACKRYIALEKAQQALIGSERLAAKGEMAASVGHELNNFMTVLSGNLQIMQMKDDRMTHEERLRHIRKSAEQVKRMTTLSKGLMDFSHLDSKPLPTDLGGLMAELVDFLEPQNRFDGIELRVECDPRIALVMLDPAQIQQVLMNLLNNAADALNERDGGGAADSPPAGGERRAGAPGGADETRTGGAPAERRIDLTLRQRARGDAVELSVQDSGPGVPDELKRRIFEPSVTTKTVGHGFGLSTVYRIVRNHGGSITVVDAPGGGALFRVTLPVRSCAGPRLVGDRTGNAPEMIAAPRARIVAAPAAEPTDADDAAA